MPVVEERLPELIKYFKEERRVVAVYLFGSYGSEYQTALSDIDFAILFEKDEDIDLMIEMEIMARISMLLKVEDIDLVNLNKAPIYLQHEIIKTGKLLFERDGTKVSDFIYYVLTYYYDERIRLNKYYQEYEKALRKEYLSE